MRPLCDGFGRVSCLNSSVAFKQKKTITDTLIIQTNDNHRYGPFHNDLFLTHSLPGLITPVNMACSWFKCQLLLVEFKLYVDGADSDRFRSMKDLQCR